MRLLVTGSRELSDPDIVHDALDKVLAKHEIDCLICGGARGADTMALNWALRHQIREIRVYPAQWDTHGKPAGPIRNEIMLIEGKPDAVVAFGRTTGTHHMAEMARERDVPVWQITI